MLLLLKKYYLFQKGLKVGQCVPLTFSITSVFSWKWPSETKNKWTELPVHFRYVKITVRLGVSITRKCSENFRENKLTKTVIFLCIEFFLTRQFRQTKELTEIFAKNKLTETVFILTGQFISNFFNSSILLNRETVVEGSPTYASPPLPSCQEVPLCYSILGTIWKALLCLWKRCQPKKKLIGPPERG